MRLILYRISLQVFAALVLAGCWRSGSGDDGTDTAEDTETETGTGDSATEVVSDADVDTDMDADTDADTDTDTDVDTDSDVDTDTDTDVDTDTDTGDDDYCEEYACRSVLPTGQTQCFDAEGVEQDPCPGTIGGDDCGNVGGCGQDAQYEHSLSLRVFTEEEVQGEIVVTDSWTGLMWQKETPDEMTWEDAMDYCRTLSYAGYEDWYLPTYHEFADLLDYGMSKPATRFPGAPAEPEYYWTSSRFFEDVVGMIGSLTTGGVEFWGTNDSFSLTHRVQCVRNETPDKPDGDSRYRVFGAEQGLVEDLATGIIWMRMVAEEQFSWYEALSYCETLTYEGYDDWRLPDLNELRSIVTIEKEIPEHPMLLDLCTRFPDLFGGHFWSSTTFLRIPDDAWQLLVGYGDITIRGKDRSGNTLCIRNEI